MDVMLSSEPANGATCAFNWSKLQPTTRVCQSGMQHNYLDEKLVSRIAIKSEMVQGCSSLHFSADLSTAGVPLNGVRADGGTHGPCALEG